VGEIRDEYDTDEVAPVQRLPEGGWAVQGGVPLADLESELGHSFAREDVSTVGGLVLAVLGRVPRAGETLALDGYRLTVDQVTRRRVRRVTVRSEVSSRPEPAMTERQP
jgi:putative hemolysin